MNCTVCGKPLLFNRVAFKCSCGAYVHAYCLDQHILEAHRPEVEEGYVDLNSDFHPVKAVEAEAEVAEEAALTTAGFELPEETEAIGSVASEIAAEKSEGNDEEAESEEDLSPGELVEEQNEEEAGAPSDEED
jgi:hypothetical protein